MIFFSGYGTPCIKRVEIHVEIQDMEIFQDRNYPGYGSQISYTNTSYKHPY